MKTSGSLVDWLILAAFAAAGIGLVLWIVGQL